MPVLLDGVGSSFVEVTVISLKRGAGQDGYGHRMAASGSWLEASKRVSGLGFRV